MADNVWYIVADVQALPGDDQPLVEGSEAGLQCFLEAPSLEAALPKLDDFLATQLFARKEIHIVQRFHRDATREEIDNDLLWEGIHEVVSTGNPCRGVLFTNRETSRWKVPPDDDGQSEPS